MPTSPSPKKLKTEKIDDSFRQMVETLLETVCVSLSSLRTARSGIRTSSFKLYVMHSFELYIMHSFELYVMHHQSVLAELVKSGENILC